MHLIELGLGNYTIADAVTDTDGVSVPGVLIRVEKHHGGEIGSPVEGPVEEGWQPGDTVITFANKASAVSFLKHVQEAVNKLEEEESDDDGCCGCGGPLNETNGGCDPCMGEKVPAQATGTDDRGEYRRIKLDSMPANWSHLRLYVGGGTVVVNKDFTEREATGTEIIGIMIFVGGSKWSYFTGPVTEYPKYVLDRCLWDDVAYIEQSGPESWCCVLKDGSRDEMFPGMRPTHKADLFNRFIEHGDWRYVTKAEAESRLEPQS